MTRTGPGRVFVYGTLLRGESNADVLGDARRLGRHVTAPVYTLYDLGAYPGARPDGLTAIVGEVYAIGPNHLDRLDMLEDYPRLYWRERIDTSFGPAWIYLVNDVPAHALVIADGHWRHTPGE